jgi:DNA-directed RNA polymerase subunit RPC12/RpoP
MEFEKGRAGETVQCPHCGVDTVLFVPVVKKAKVVAHQTQTAVSYEGGMEHSIGDVGGVSLALGIFGGVGSVLGALVLFDDNQHAWGIACLIAAAVCVLQGVAINILFKAGGDVIRLLKKLNGLKYGGEISKATERLSFATSYACSDCGAPINTASQGKCGKCGAGFGP